MRQRAMMPHVGISCSPAFGGDGWPVSGRRRLESCWTGLWPRRRSAYRTSWLEARCRLTRASGSLGDPERADHDHRIHASMTCPHCAAFHADTFKPIAERGLGRHRQGPQFIFRAFPASIARGAAARRVWPECMRGKISFFPLILDLLFSAPSPTWSRAVRCRSGGADRYLANLQALHRRVLQAQACLNQQLEDDPDPHPPAAQGRRPRTYRGNFNSTPSFLVNGESGIAGEYLGSRSMSALIDSLL